MKHTNLHLVAVFSASAFLSGCSLAPNADSETVKAAVALSLNAELQSGKVENVADLPIGKSFATNLSGGKRFVVAKKTGNSQTKNCSEFDLSVSNPSTKYLWGLFHANGDSDYESGVEICAPR